MHRGMFFIALAALIASVAPAMAQTSVPIPEPTDLTLFTLAVIGLIIGRRSSRARPKRDDDEQA